MLAGAFAGGNSSGGDYAHYEGDAAPIVPSSISHGTQKTEAEAYSSLGKYNPCIFIACDGE